MRHELWPAAQWVLAPRYGTMLRRTVREQMRPLSSGTWLDVGCGPRSRIANLLTGTTFGVDSAVNRLFDAQRDGVVCVCASATELPFAEGSFDGVVCFGLLHHLNEADADAALVEMCRVTRPGGAVLLYDNIGTRSALRRPLAALLRALDQGEHIRAEGALRRLLDRPRIQHRSARHVLMDRA